MEILFLSRWFPYPADNGSKLRISQLLAGLAKFHRVTLISFTEGQATPVDLKAASGLDRIAEVMVLPWREYQPGSLRAMMGFFQSTPRSLLDTYSQDMADLIRRTLTWRSYDLVIASQLSMASYFESFQDVPAIFEEIELGLFYDRAVSAERGLKRLRLNLTWFKIKGYFSRLLRSFRSCTVASERERQLFVQNFPQHQYKINVIPNCLDIESYQHVRAEPRPNHLIFSGSFRYRANYEAMQWFIREVYPRILERIPDAHLIITGEHDSLPLPPAKNVVMAGHVKDIKSLIASCTVSLAPLRVGGGTRLKILEAMALGTPVVATSKGSEGLGATNGEHLLIADSPEAFAASVLSILVDSNRRQQLAITARHFVTEHFSWNANLPRFLKLVDLVAYNGTISRL